jgi:DNA-directed RNA polymerase specialized sigma24 family protein
MPAERAKKDPVLELTAQAVALDDAPLSDVRGWQSLSDEELRAFVSSKDSQARMLRVVKARIRRGTPADVVADLVQEASLEALTSKWRPRTLATAPGWLATLTVRTVARHFRQQDEETQWLEVDSEIDERGAPDAVPDAEWLISKWLAKAVAGSERDQETCELIAYKATTGRTYEEVARDHAMTEGALKSRFFTLKTKYEPRWRQRQRTILLLLLLGAIGLALLVVWLFRRPPHEHIEPAHDFVIPADKPSAVPTEGPFNQALPPDPPPKPNKGDKPPMRNKGDKPSM